MALESQLDKPLKSGDSSASSRMANEAYSEANRGNWNSSGTTNTASEHLPSMSIENGLGTDEHNALSAPGVAPVGDAGIGSAQPMENSLTPLAANGQSSEAGISKTPQSTATGGGEGNILSSISSGLQSDMNNLADVMQQFTNNLTSAETGVGQNGDTQQPSTAGSDNAAASGSTDSSNSSGGPSMTQQLQSVLSYLGIPSGSNSSPESFSGFGGAAQIMANLPVGGKWT